MKESEIRDRYRATLLNLAAGDRLGLPIENLTAEQIRERHGKVTEPLGMDAIRATRDDLNEEVSDDTFLSLAVVESYSSKRRFDLADIAKRHVKEMVVRTRPDGKVMGGFGSSTRRSLQELMRHRIDEVAAISHASDGPGNGPIMKVSGTALHAHATDNERYFRYEAQSIGWITHRDPRSVTGGVVQADAVYRLLNNSSKREFIEAAVNVSNEFEGKPSFTTKDYMKVMFVEGPSLTEQLRWVEQHRDDSDEKAHQKLGSGGAAFSSYPFTLFMFQKYWDDPVEGMIRLVNFGGDTDTTGSMFGALAGARFGLVFPESWTEGLPLKDRLIRAADDLFKLRGTK